MHRLVWPGVAWLLVLANVPLAAQRAGDPPAPILGEPRPAPAFPMALVPFSIPNEWCRGGDRPTVTLRAHNSLGVPVHSLRMRGAAGAVIDRLPLRCGAHVAFWDGTVGDPPRLPLPHVFYVQLAVQKEGIRTQLRTVKLAATQ
jgi:hypothetical protein